ncbi:hypothetical protein EV138_4044 [Kribbella voronezhensis]|uniref:Uncharacterized protein n=1 Tax=Kribbella voronezhensis TaxID=2512212 RepID=A0A4V3FKJ6_9ACTN|nr:hypothetical protein [Kribbella voronezhensis]TDU90453.1 hypothetical protein EV138_4044 [Kribbella voronezhensis]
MTTTARTPDASRQPTEPGTGARTGPRWMPWAPRLALIWALTYGAVRVWFAIGHAPDWILPSDLLIPAWASVAACLASAGLVLAVTRWPRSRALIVTTWAAAAGWVAVCALALLDLVGAALPGLGLPFDLPALLSRAGGLTGAALLAATALARRRQLDPTCLYCVGKRSTLPTAWATAGAWLAVAGCLGRLAAQAAVGFDVIPYDAGPSVLLFEGGFLLAGVALPLLLVYRLGRVFPRWMLLLPGAALGAGITAYFGVGLIQMITEALQGERVFDGIDLPAAFFWVAVPCYLVWGLGLTTATYGYYARTRKPCERCG